MADGAGKETATREVRSLVASGNRQSYVIWRVLGWGLAVPSVITVALCALVLLVMLAAALLMAVVSGPVDVAELGAPVLALVAALVVCGAFGLLGLGALREVRGLDRLRLRIDERGITRESEPRLALPWDRIGTSR